MSDIDFKDALVYASIENIINERNFLNRNAEYWRSKSGDAESFYDQYTPRGEAYINFTNSINLTSNDKQKELNDLLINTTIKRACCLGNPETPDTTNQRFKITVKLPYVEELVPSTVDSGTKELWKTFGFMTKEILVPKYMCGDLSKPTNTNNVTTYCDKFYRAYCENAKQMYALDLSGINNPAFKYNSEDFRRTTPDCACFIDRLKEYSTGLQPACYANTCLSSSAAFTDNVTRKEGACKLSQCIANIKVGDVTAIDNAKAQVGIGSVVQNCGDAIRKIETNPGASSDQLRNAISPTPTPTTTSTPTTSPTTSPTTTPSNALTKSLDIIEINNSNTKLYIGIGIGIFILLIVVIVIIFLLTNKKNRRYR